MCVVVTVCYFTAVFLSPKKGLIPKRLRKWRLSKQIQKEDIIKYLNKQGVLSPSKLSEAGIRLDITIPKMKSHLSSLINSGHIEKLKDGFNLTESGTAWGQDLVRAHRLWETFLVDKVGLKGDEIHEDAEKYEHLLDMEFLDQLDAKLGYPTTDPHGSPIPAKTGLPHQVLARLKTGSRGRISHAQQDAQVESKLWELSLTPGSVVTVDKNQEDKLVIQHKDEIHDIPSSLAQLIRVDELNAN